MPSERITNIAEDESKHVCLLLCFQRINSSLVSDGIEFNANILAKISSNNIY